MIKVHFNMNWGQIEKFSHAVSSLSDEVSTKSVKNPLQKSFCSVHHESELIWINWLELFKDLVRQ
jgi:hypothetical protein